MTVIHREVTQKIHTFELEVDQVRMTAKVVFNPPGNFERVPDPDARKKAYARAKAAALKFVESIEKWQKSNP